MNAAAFHLPRPGALLRHALPTLAESTLLPLAIFYGSLQLIGTTGAIVAALAWAYGALVVRVVRRQPIPGLLVLSIVSISVRTVLSLATGSVFLYFLQPTLGTILVAGVFLASIRTGKPLAERLAADLVPLPESWLGSAWLRRFFARVTILWALVFLVNGLVSLQLLMTQSVGSFVLTRTATSTGLTVAAIGVSFVYFLRCARRAGAAIVGWWAKAEAPAS